MSNKLTAIQAIEEAIDSLNKKLLESDRILLRLNGDAQLVVKSFQDVKTPKDVAPKIKDVSDVTEQLNAQLKEQDRLERALIRQIEKKTLATESTARALEKERFETKQANKLVKEAAVLSSRYASAIQKAAVKRNQAVRAVQDFTVKQKLGIKLTKLERKELKKAELAFNKYDKAVRAAREKTGRFQDSVGNYEKGFKGVLNLAKNLIGVYGAVEGIRLIFDFGKEAAAMAREAKGVEFAFDRLGIKGVKAFNDVKAATRGLLSDVDIKKALVDFDNFNISLEQSADLFEFLAVRSVQTGQSIEKLQSSLVEGLSKESKLRIDNLGISTATLNEELEKTPNFVQAVANIAKTEIAEAGGVIDEAANSQEKLNAAFDNFKVSAGQGFLGKLTNEWIGFKTSLIETFNIVNDNSESFLDFLINLGRVGQGQGAAVAAEAFAKNYAKERIAAVERVLKLQKAQGASEEILIRNRKQLLELDVEQLNNIAAELEKRKEVNREKVRSIEYLNELIAKEQQRLLGSTSSNQSQAIQENIKALEAERDALLNKRNALVAVKGSIGFYQELIAQLTEQQTKLATTSEKFKEYQEKIDAAREAIVLLKGELVEISERDYSLEGTLTDAEVTNELALGFFSWRMDREKELNREANEEKLKQDKEYAEKRGALEQQLFDSINNLVNTLYANRIQRIDDEINKNNDKFADLLDNERLTEMERSQIEAERDRKEKELQKQKREQQRKQAIFNKAIRITEITLNTAEAVSEAAPNPYLIALAVGIGAAQLAAAIATPIPRYEKGKNVKDKYEGPAIWGERKREVRFGRRGVELSPKYPGLHKTHVYSDDVIHPDADAFFADLEQQLKQNSISASFMKNNNSANTIIDSGRFRDNSGPDRIIKAIERNRSSFKVVNDINLGDRFRYLERLNDTL